VPRGQVCTACWAEGHNRRTCRRVPGVQRPHDRVDAEAAVLDPYRLLALAVLREALASPNGRREIAAGHPDLRAWCVAAGVPWATVAGAARAASTPATRRERSPKRDEGGFA